ncbi:MAG TPA: O-antigen ligase family protein [Verrucomicrobiae bacterium]|nr:O-antigen ligase family protein [Verrucomicrobiae bacterium]
MTPEKKFSAPEWFALVFGLFLGLCIWKFGNPVILDQKISAPVSVSEFFNYSWPPHWANWIFWPLAIAGVMLAFKNPNWRWPTTHWLWLLPLLWFGWQLLSARQTVDADLTATTLCHFAACVMCYFFGAFLFGRQRALNFLLVGILAAFAFCLIRGVDQRIVEFPQSRQMLLEGQRTGWTNFPPDLFAEMKRDGVIFNTNGVDVISSKILDKFKSGRVMGTLVYPNALAGLILLLFPLSLTLAFSGTKNLRPIVRACAIALTLFLGVAAFYFTGSKSGWLIAMAMGGVYLLRLRWPAKWKIAAVTAIAVLGLGVFALRFHHYFAKGATSVEARFDYWRAAVQTAASEPLFGTGPGTFQHPYARLKSPASEMTRLTHNDFLEQFSDSGIPGGLFYTGWIFIAFVFIGRRLWKSQNQIISAISLGLFGWFVQGLVEFELYVPTLAWIAFTLLGYTIVLAANNGSTEFRPPTKIPAK